MATKRKTISKINLSLKNVRNATRKGVNKPLKKVVGRKGRLN